MQDETAPNTSPPEPDIETSERSWIKPLLWTLAIVAAVALAAGLVLYFFMSDVLATVR